MTIKAKKSVILSYILKFKIFKLIAKCLSTEILSMSGHLNSKRPMLYMLLEDQKGESVQEKMHLNMPTFNHMIFLPTFCHYLQKLQSMVISDTSYTEKNINQTDRSYTIQ